MADPVATGMDPRCLIPGENPPTVWAALMAEFLPPWTDARTYGLPTTVFSLDADDYGGV